MALAEIIASNAPLGIRVTKEAAIDIIPHIKGRVMDNDDA